MQSIIVSFYHADEGVRSSIVLIFSYIFFITFWKSTR